MEQTNLTTAWMWANGQGGVNGANVDVEAKRIYWYDDAAACACGTSAAVQNFEQFLQDGGVFGDMPDDVAAEMHATVKKVLD